MQNFTRQIVVEGTPYNFAFSAVRLRGAVKLFVSVSCVSAHVTSFELRRENLSSSWLFVPPVPDWINEQLPALCILIEEHEKTGSH